ncbi:hypothetical protein GR183_20570 [Stappia sp. GBMRC 2046]|uniref:O-antigen ligase-related domain-containing protein n=1 Tax=Stappia sediminis TaxID=2692190 RepID=A0A7X3LY97_9HYPH|nr:O-antigen ligase family protein [Stappia sediminis]MXN67310.1 hypothetical protein [Stappia sediminis]
MTALTATTGPFPKVARSPVRPTAGGVTAAALWVAVFLGGFVIREPAPYELYMLALVSVWAIFGLTLSSGIGPMVVCYLVYIAGGLLSVTVAGNLGQAAMYVAVSGFLAITAIFYAAVVADDPRRLGVIRSAYVASAAFVGGIGILGYFGLIPGAELFTLYDRAKGTFEDPNVFGPFLVLPTAFIIRDILTRPLRECRGAIALTALLVLAIFLSFSRAAWGLLAFTGLGLYLLVFIGERSSVRRARLVGLAIAGTAFLIALLAVALSFDMVSSLFEERARLVQDYDASRLGRFARHAAGFQMIMDKPLGLGALEFRNFFPEDEHNSYLKAFTSYGWLGGFSYFILMVWTLVRLFPLVFQPRAWQPYAQCIFVVFFGHALIAVVIDTDHWRHMYMLVGLAWGLIAAESGVLRRLRAKGAQTRKRISTAVSRPLAPRS